MFCNLENVMLFIHDVSLFIYLFLIIYIDYSPTFIFVEILFWWFICIQYLTFVSLIARVCIQLLIDRDLVKMIDPG